VRGSEWFAISCAASNKPPFCRKTVIWATRIRENTQAVDFADDSKSYQEHYEILLKALKKGGGASKED
jgi:hypothetical protein